jgi:3-oxoacyl-[acyl-carrier-protein] synthase II
MGLISPLGNSSAELWNGLSGGRSGIDLLTLVPTEHFPSDIGGECHVFTGNVAEFGELDKKLTRSVKKSLKLMCREIQMGVAAAQLGLAEYLPNMPASHVAILNDLQGPSNSLTVREASSNIAVAEAMTIIQRGSADAMVVGATGSRIHPLRTIHVALQEQLADRNASPSNGDPQKASRPFDLHRTGMVLGEGAAVLILEELETAQKRGANILAEVIGYGSSSVIDTDGVADYKTAIGNVILSALETSGKSASEIGHVHAHGLSAVKVDREEATAIKETLNSTPVTAAKSYMGNLGAGSGMVEIIASVMAMENDSLFPILNFETPDPDCPINAVKEPASPGDCFINLNVTPQGQASSMLIAKPS